LLPPGVTLDEKSQGRAFFWFLDWQWAQGFPKKLGSIYQTRSFSAPSAAAAPLAKGSRFGASVAAHGERLATARLQLEEKVTDPAKVFNRPTVMRRYFPQLAAARQTKPPVDELTILGDGPADFEELRRLGF
jgi:Acetoacetate decarboxylase (ADC)